MCKGADSVLMPLLKDKEYPKVKELVEKTFQFMEDYAKDGLRTLLFVEKIISEEDYTDWMFAYQKASMSLENRDKKVENVALQIEKDFQLVGSTGIEDKL